jgi:hypothetical protein
MMIRPFVLQPVASLAIVFGCLPAGAEPLDQTAEIGRGLICDTAKQLERFVALQNEGQDIATAVHNVNEEARSPIACGIISAAFIRGEPVAQGTMRGSPVSIVKITVVAIGSGSEWNKVPATTQYTIFGTEGPAL